jgi:hypothetical protein
MTEVMAQMDAISNALNPEKLVPAVFEGVGVWWLLFSRDLAMTLPSSFVPRKSLRK